MSLINHSTFPALDGSQHFKRWESAAATRRLSPTRPGARREGAGPRRPRPALHPEAPEVSAPTGRQHGGDWVGPYQNPSRRWAQNLQEAGAEGMAGTGVSSPSPSPSGGRRGLIDGTAQAPPSPEGPARATQRFLGMMRAPSGLSPGPQACTREGQESLHTRITPIPNPAAPGHLSPAF